MAQVQLHAWASQKIEKLLQMQPGSCSEIVENMLAYDDAQELKEFLGEFIEKSAFHQVNSFVEELFQRRAGPSAKPSPAARPPPQNSANERSSGQPVSGRGCEGKGGGKGGRGGGRGDSSARDFPKICADGAGRGRGRGRPAPVVEQDDFPKMQMPTYSRQEGDRRRMVIDAASGRHKVLTNCLNCGKVVTEEEGWGPCLFCGNPLEARDQNGKKTGDQRGFLESAGEATAEEKKFNESFERAKQTKDRLLSYDRDVKKRTKVYDDATDWYSEAANPWLSEKQREEATRLAAEEERRKKEEKRKIHATIDIFGRTVISAEAEIQAKVDQQNKDKFEAWTEGVVNQNRLMSMMEKEQKGMGGRSQLSNESTELYDRLRASLHAAGKDKSGFMPVTEKEPRKNVRWDATDDDRVAANEFSDITTSDFSKGTSSGEIRLLPPEESPWGDSEDLGHCLSMHQPWASLLIHGCKRAEGRSWKTDHCGRLWIHAAAKPAEEGDIELLEQTYRSMFESQGVPMPPLPSQSFGYPTSVLLGCVDMDACWTNQEYKKVLQSNPSMPQDESSCDHVFWCMRPRRLAVPLRMGGDHKIWRLPKPCLAAAQRGLQPVRWPAPGVGECMMSSPSIPAAEAKMKKTSAAKANSGKAADVTDEGKPRHVEASVPPPLLDLWPLDNSGERLEVVGRDNAGTDRDVVVLQNGFVQLVGFVPADLQQRIVDTIREIGVSDKGFFHEPFDGLKTTVDVTRLYLGMHWNSVSQTWEKVRGNAGATAVADLPKMLLDVYSEAIKRANREMSIGPNKKRKLTPFVEDKAPSLGVVNFYGASGSMQIHQDKMESQKSIDAGYPVIGICIGDGCELTYSTEDPASGKKPKAVRLASGDVYIFGGESRKLWHGVSRILPKTAPPSLRLVPGRLNVTLRVL